MDKKNINKEELIKLVHELCEECNKSYGFDFKNITEDFEEDFDKDTDSLIEDEKMDFLHDIRCEFDGFVRGKFVELNIIEDEDSTDFDDLICEEVWEWLTDQI